MWRRKHPEIIPELNYEELSGADLTGAILWNTDLNHANLSHANLSGADLQQANLERANLTGSNLVRARLSQTNLNHAQLTGADLRNARLSSTYLHAADLTDADLRGAELIGTLFFDANLRRANIALASTFYAVFVGTDLSEVKGLDVVEHKGPSEVSVNTIYLSEGKIPEVFLRGCGLTESFIVQIPALVAAMQAIQFYSCFISYSGKDEEFARRLHSRMRQAELRVWFAPEDMKGGDKLYDQIDRAIQVHDRLLVVLSESSMQSKWVETEIRRARKVELREGRRKLFPIRLVSYEMLQEWVCIDSVTGEDLAEEVRSYFIPDFSSWKSHDDFESAFARLLADLKASAG